MRNIEDALQQFGSKIGLPGIKLNADRICALTVGDGFEITFEATGSDEKLRLNGQIGYLKSPDTEMLRGLLIANYNGQATGDAALSMDPVSGEVILGQLIDVGPLDAADFVSTVETFLKYLTFWTKHLPTLSPAPATDGWMESANDSMIRI